MGHITLSYQNFQVIFFSQNGNVSLMLLSFSVSFAILLIKHLYLQVTDTPGILRRCDGKNS